MAFTFLCILALCVFASVHQTIGAATSACTPAFRAGALCGLINATFDHNASVFEKAPTANNFQCSLTVDGAGPFTSPNAAACRAGFDADAPSKPVQGPYCTDDGVQTATATGEGESGLPGTPLRVERFHYVVKADFATVGGKCLMTTFAADFTTESGL